MKNENVLQIDSRQPALRLRGTAKRSVAGWKIWAGKRREGFRDESGNAVLEMAFLVPIFLALITGIFSFALAYYHQLTLTQAVGTGAQYLQQLSQKATDPCAQTLSAIQGAATSLNPSQIQMSLSINGGPAIQQSTCPSEASTLAAAVNEPFTVSATYPCNLQVFGMQFASSCQVSAEASEYVYSNGN